MRFQRAGRWSAFLLILLILLLACATSCTRAQEPVAEAPVAVPGQPDPAQPPAPVADAAAPSPEAPLAAQIDPSQLQQQPEQPTPVQSEPAPAAVPEQATASEPTPTPVQPEPTPSPPEPAPVEPAPPTPEVVPPAVPEIIPVPQPPVATEASVVQRQDAAEGEAAPAVQSPDVVENVAAPVSPPPAQEQGVPVAGAKPTMTLEEALASVEHPGPAVVSLNAAPSDPTAAPALPADSVPRTFAKPPPLGIDPVRPRGRLNDRARERDQRRRDEGGAAAGAGGAAASSYQPTAAQHASSHAGHNAISREDHLAHLGHGHLTDPKTTMIKHGSHSHTVEDTEAHGGLIFGTTIGVMFLAQGALFLWKKYHLSSFDKATLVGLWIFPAAFSAWHGIVEYWRMLTLWSLFSIASGMMLRRALAKPVARDTPRLVYSFFFWCYKLSYATAFSAYLIIMAHFLGLGGIPLLPSPSTAVLLLFYGLYFGVLGRDLANVCSSNMAISMGYVARKGEIPRKAVPGNICAICDTELIKSFRPVGGGVAPDADEKVHTLNCSHSFHDFCLRGWTMIGKRDTCASCNEKVLLKETLKGPWETTSVAWAVLLDGLRYVRSTQGETSLVVYNPIVICSAQIALYLVY